MNSTSGAITNMKRIKQPAHLVDAGLELGGSPIRGRHALGQRPEIGPVAGGHHDGGGRAGHHVRAHEQDVVQLQRIGRAPAPLLGELLHRQGFAGHGRLVDEQILRAQNAAIGRDHVAGGEHDHIAGHQQLDRDFDAARRLDA